MGAMVSLMTQPPALTGPGEISHDGGGVQARVELIPLHRWGQCCMLPKYLVIFLPSWASMALGLPDDQPPVGEEVARLGIRGEHCRVCQETRNPGQRGLDLPQPWLRKACIEAVWPWECLQLRAEGHVVC